MAKGRNNSSNEARGRGGVTRRSSGAQGQTMSSDRGRRGERSTAADAGRSSGRSRSTISNGAGGSGVNKRRRSASAGRGGSNR